MMDFRVRIICFLIVLYMSIRIDGNEVRRVYYAMCPPHFIRIGHECYFVSEDRANWLDAYFNCKDRGSRLAELFKQEDRDLRKYFNKFKGIKPNEMWIGARFNWERNKWQWGHDGKYVHYQSFSQMSGDRTNLKFHCAILKEDLKYRWSASSCEKEHQYLCQHRMPYVNSKKRQKVYDRWNETYPNEMANEIEVKLSRDDLSRKRKQTTRLYSKIKTNQRQTKNDQNRRQNEVRFDDYQPTEMHVKQINPYRKSRMQNIQPRNQTVANRFDIKLNRAGGVRQPILFNNTYPKNPSRGYRRRQKWFYSQLTSTTNNPNRWPITSSSTTTTTTTTTTTRRVPITRAPPTTPAPVIHQYKQSNQENDDRNAESRYEDDLRRNQEQIEEEKRKEHHRLMEEERLRDQIKRQEMERQLQNQFNQRNYQTTESPQKYDEHRRRDDEIQRRDELQRREELQQREEQIPRHDDQINSQNAIQTNEILDNVSTTMSPLKIKTRGNDIRSRISRLPKDQQEIFIKRLCEKKDRTKYKRNSICLEYVSHQNTK